MMTGGGNYYSKAPSKPYQPVSGTVPRSSGYVPTYLRAAVGGGGHGVSASGPQTLLAGRVGTRNAGAFAPTSSTSSALTASQVALQPVHDLIGSIMGPHVSSGEGTFAPTSSTADAARTALNNAGVSYYPTQTQTSSQAAQQFPGAPSLTSQVPMAGNTLTRTSPVAQPTTPSAMPSATMPSGLSATSPTQVPGVATGQGGDTLMAGRFVNPAASAAPPSGSAGSTQSGGSSGGGAPGGGASSVSTTYNPGAIGQQGGNAINQGQQAQGNEGQIAQTLGNTGAGFGQTLANAGSQGNVSTGVGNSVATQDQQMAQQLQNPAALQTLAENQLNQWTSQQFGQLNNAYQNMMNQMAAQGIAQGGAPRAGYESLLQSLIGGRQNEETNLVNQLLANQQSNDLAAGTLGQQALTATNLPFTQQMQLAGMQDQALGQSMGAYGNMASQSYGLGGQLLGQLEQYYQAQQMLPMYASMMSGMPAMLGSLFSGLGLGGLVGGTSPAGTGVSPNALNAALLGGGSLTPPGGY